MNVSLPRDRTEVISSKHSDGEATRPFADHPFLTGAIAGVAFLGLSALVNRQLAWKAEHDTPAPGRFLVVRGVRLHVFEQGEGEPLVLLHGNASMVEDFISSGLIDVAASRYRVIAFDRPGHGHSTRPRGVAWTDVEQAELIAAALKVLGIARAVVLGHSLGCSVAVALALNHPDIVSALVLASGYYYPSARMDAVASAGLTTPVVGDVFTHAVSPVLARMMWPMSLRKMFGPASVPSKFDAFPKEMTFRPSQIKASAEDSALMIPDAAVREARYRELKMPVAIIAGEGDRMVDIDNQSGRFHASVPQSTFRRVAGSGHMVHQTATDEVIAAIDAAAENAAQVSTPRPFARKPAAAY